MVQPIKSEKVLSGYCLSPSISSMQSGRCTTPRKRAPLASS